MAGLIDNSKTASEMRKVLSNHSHGGELFGVSRMVLTMGLCACAIGWGIADWHANHWLVELFFRSLGLFFLAGIAAAAFHARRDLPVGQHAYRIINHMSRQHTIVNTRNGSRKEQPLTNNNLLAKLRRSRVVRATRFSLGRDERAADHVDVKQPFHGSSAVESEDGVVGAIKVEPAPMAVADFDDWEDRVDSFANAIDVGVVYETEFTGKMRAVDYSTRKNDYAYREAEFLNKLANKHGSVSEAYRLAREEPEKLDEESVGWLISSELCDERQNTIDLYDVTTMQRHYYVVAKITPEDIVTPDHVTSDSGGWDNVPGASRYVKRQRLKELRQSGDYRAAMIEELEDYLDSLVNELGQISDVSPRKMSSVEYSQAIADHYQAANVYAQRDFTDLLRMAPQPAEGDGSSLYGVSHDHLQNFPNQTIGGPSPEAPNAGRHPDAVSAGDVGAEVEKVPEEQTKGMAQRIAEVNNNPRADVVRTEEELIDHYQCLVGPGEINCEPKNWVEIDNAAYSKTYSIRNWPPVPNFGILEPILREQEPGVAVNVSKYVRPLDQRDAETELGSNQYQEQKAVETEEKSWFTRIVTRSKNQKTETEEMIEANMDSEFDLFKSNTHLELRSDDPDAIKRTVDSIVSSMNRAGAAIEPEDHYHLEGYKSVAPTCNDMLEEPVFMFSDAIAREFMWASRNLHEPGGVEFGINMQTQEPIYCDFFNRQGGFDFGIYTHKGGGKTTTATEILERLKLVYGDDLWMAIIDPLQEYVNCSIANNGHRMIAGGDEGLNPFHLEATPEEKLQHLDVTPYKVWTRSCIEFVEMYYQIEGIEFTGKNGVWREAIKEAGKRLGVEKDPKTHSAEWRKEHDYSGDLPTPLDAIHVINEMSENGKDFVHGIDGEPPSDAKVEERERTAIDIINNDVDPFRAGGEYEHFTKQSEVDLKKVSLVYADMQQQESKSSVGLTMHVLHNLFYETAKQLDKPAIIFMDEFHYMLRDTMAQKSLNNKVRHARHFDLSFGTATQSFKDYFGKDEDGEVHLTDNAQVLFEGQPTQIFHKDEITPEWREEIDMTDDEAKFVKEAERGNAKLGYSTALLRVEDKGSYPLKVKLDTEENPRETVFTEYDPGDHGEDFLAFCKEYNHIANWRFMPEPKDTGTPEVDDQEGEGMTHPGNDSYATRRGAATDPGPQAVGGVGLGGGR